MIIYNTYMLCDLIKYNKIEFEMIKMAKRSR